MTQPKREHRVPDLLVEKVFLNEATDEERARVLADPDAKARLQALPMENARFLVAHPPEEVVPRIEGRARTAEARDRLTRRNGALGGVLLVPLFAVALALFVVGAPEKPVGTGPGTEQTTAKGLNSKLRVYHQTAKGVRRIGTGEVLRSGDRLQLGIVPGEAKHAVVLSIDGRGGFTRHFPAEGGATGIGGGGEQRLPDGFQLDDAPDYERFVLVTDDEPIDVAAVETAVRALAGSPEAKGGTARLPKGLSQSWFLVRKEER